MNKKLKKKFLSILLLSFFAFFSMFCLKTKANSYFDKWNFTATGEGFIKIYGDNPDYTSNIFKSSSSATGSVIGYNFTHSLYSAPYFYLNTTFQMALGGGNQMRVGFHNSSSLTTADNQNLILYIHDGNGHYFLIQDSIYLYDFYSGYATFTDGDYFSIIINNSREITVYRNGIFQFNFTANATTKDLMNPSITYLTLGSRVTTLGIDNVSLSYTNVSCESNFQNVSYSDWQEMTVCSQLDFQLMNRTYIQNDLNSCYSNTTFTELSNFSCSFCDDSNLSICNKNLNTSYDLIMNEFNMIEIIALIIIYFGFLFLGFYLNSKKEKVLSGSFLGLTIGFDFYLIQYFYLHLIDGKITSGFQGFFIYLFGLSFIFWIIIKIMLPIKLFYNK